MSKKLVSFSLAAASEPVRAQSKRVHEEVEDSVKESITEFSVRDPNAKVREERKVIQSKPNRLASNRKERDDTNALGSMEERFEQAAVRQTVGDGVYGLLSGNAEASTSSGPAEHTGGRVKMSTITDDLPDAPTDEYEDMPVDQFASALLRGMGLQKHNVVPTVELVARPSRMGLGAKVGDMSTRSAKPLLGPCSLARTELALTTERGHADTSKRSYKELVGADGSAKSIIREGEQVIDKATLGPKVGKKMTIAEGRHSGLECVVRDLAVGGNEGVPLSLITSDWRGA